MNQQVNFNKKKNYQFVYSEKKNLLNTLSETPFFLWNLNLIFLIFLLRKKIQKIFDQKKKIIIVANGPSLTKSISHNVYYKSLNKAQFITMNDAPIKSFFFKLKPKIHLLIDSAYFKNYFFLNKNVKSDIKKTFQNLNQIKWNLTIIVPNRTKQFLKKTIKNNKILIVEFPSMNYDFDSSLYLKLCSYLELPPPRISVTISALYLALISGNREIELIGADQTIFKDFDINQSNNEGFMNMKHFSISKNNSYKFTHKLSGKKSESMFVRLLRSASCFKWFAYLAMIAKKNNINLKNKSFYSLIDSIER
jgi:hypothetical protein